MVAGFTVRENAASKSFQFSATSAIGTASTRHDQMIACTISTPEHFPTGDAHHKAAGDKN